MIEHVVSGGGAVRLHVVEAGNAAAPAIVFLHGWSGSHLVWSRQLDSGLAERHRLVAVDLRGHGDSEKPDGAYAAAELWAADITGVITALGLDQPILCGWSYGGLVINDYLRCCGDGAIGGVHYVGAATDLGIPTPYRFLGAAWDGLMPGGDGDVAGTVFSGGLEDGAPAMRTFVRRCFGDPLSPGDEMMALGLNVLCPPRVRAALLSRAIANDDVLHSIRVPVLISHGDADEVIGIETAHHIAQQVRHAQLSLYEGAGHAMFWHDAPRFNRELADFAAGCAARVTHDGAAIASRP